MDIPASSKRYTHVHSNPDALLYPHHDVYAHQYIHANAIIYFCAASHLIYAEHYPLPII